MNERDGWPGRRRKRGLGQPMATQQQSLYGTDRVEQRLFLRSWLELQNAKPISALHILVAAAPLSPSCIAVRTRLHPSPRRDGKYLADRHGSVQALAVDGSCPLVVFPHTWHFPQLRETLAEYPSSTAGLSCPSSRMRFALYALLITERFLPFWSIEPQINSPFSICQGFVTACF